jgi:hypothetical protein
MSALANDPLVNEAAQNATINERNAANAQHSTGPVTPEGKDRIKFNALKSGLFARTIVLPGEDLADYQAIGAGLTEYWKPRTDMERELILTIQNTTWRRDRVVQTETALYALGAHQHIEEIREKFSQVPADDHYALAEATGFQVNARAFDQLWRHEGRLQRALDRAQRELKALVAARPPEPPKQPAAQPAVQPAVQPDPAPPTPPSGFVPHKYPKHMPSFTGPNAKTYRRLWLQKNGFANLT